MRSLTGARFASGLVRLRLRRGMRMMSRVARG